jgi:hypothetical protein
MSLINCPECEKAVSETATVCPGCGFTLTPDVVAALKDKKQKETQEATLQSYGCIGVLILAILVCCGVVWQNADLSSTAPPEHFDPFEYNDATDSSLKLLPSMRGYSDSDKETIIHEAKKLDAAVKELERQRKRGH